jgi:transcriptional regulator with XRE-family HTH domain
MLLCMKEKKITKKKISSDLGLGINQIKYWQDHQNTPAADVVAAIADYLDVSADYLLGRSERPDRSLPNPYLLNDHELRMLTAYRSAPDMQLAVDRLLGISDEELVPVYAAAHSEDNRPDGIVFLTRAQWEELQKLPESDDPLL